MKTPIYLLTLFSLFACAQENYEIVGTTESFNITSTNVNDDFKIEVYLPPAYPESGVDYPLLIGLDGDNEFETMAGIVSQEIKNGNIPPAIFVSIGYGSEEENDQKRNRDYTPSVTQGVEDFETGGAENFYHFIQNELIPTLQNLYQIDTRNNKTLMGHSYGGLFTMFAMFQNRSDNPFDKFIPVAASFWYDSGVIFEYEATFSQNNEDFVASIFTAMGSLEGAVMVASFEEMNEKINGRNYPNLLYKSEVLKKYGHSRSDYITYEKGLKYVFEN